MNKVLALFLCVASFVCNGAESGMPLEKARVDVFDLDSVRRGAGYFASYCLGCHSIKQIRYSRIGTDLKISDDPKSREELMREEFMFGDAKIHDNIRTAMASADSEVMFGVVPPDLSLVIRARGADWVYSYLKGFYIDPARPFGVNNTVVENVAMPNVLWELQGTQEPVLGTRDGNPVVVGVRLTKPGNLSSKEFDKYVNDLVNFLAYVAEPAKLERLPLGKYVIAFLIFLTVILYKLKKEYWKDVD